MGSMIRTEERIIQPPPKVDSECLLPGIPNEVTLNNISTKVSWRDSIILSSVSRAWCHAIRSRQVYSARLQHGCRETLVLVHYSHSGRRKGGIVLCSMKDNSCYVLPAIPNVVQRFPAHCRSVSLDGKIYVLGGRFGLSNDLTTSTVYVLDLSVGQRPWKQCADMIKGRARFPCGVMDGKIYVFGYDSGVCAEVYDPKEDTWSQIGLRIELHALKSPRCADVLGEEFLLHGGLFFDQDRLIRRACGLVEPQVFHLYNPTKNEWREIRTPGHTDDEVIFTAKEKLHQMYLTDQFPIQIYNAGENSWTCLHSSSFASLGSVDEIRVKPMSFLAVNDELLAVVSCRSRRIYETGGFHLVRTAELGKCTEEIRWQKAIELTLEAGVLDERRTAVFMHAIEV
ncbi:unnamed protein product [Calypogeia fissa]